MKLLLVWIAACGFPGVLADKAEPAAADATFEVAENSPEGTLVGTVPHSPDATRFELPADDESAPFSVDAATGRITVRNPEALDFETRRGFTLRVRVTMKAAEPEEDPLWKSFAERLGADGGDELLAPRETVVERRIRVKLVDVEEPVPDPEPTDPEPAPAGSDSETTTAGTERPVVRIIGPPIEAPRPSFPPRNTGPEPAIAGTDPAVPDPVTPAPDVPLTTPSDPAIAGPADPEQTRGPVLLLPGDVRPTPSDEPGQVTSDPSPEVPVQPAPAAMPVRDSVAVQAPPPVKTAYWLVLMVLLVLAGIAAHVARVRALRRRWAQSERGQDANSEWQELDPETLVAAAQDLADQREALTEDFAKLAEDQARLAEEQQQLECGREDLLARESQLAAAEAQLADERAELERQRQELEIERLRLQEERTGMDRRPRRDDLYEVDDDRPKPPSPGGDPGASTWVDSSGLDSIEHDAELEALRAGLADMLAMSPEQDSADEHADGSRQGSLADEKQPRQPEVPQWSPPPGGSRDSLYRRTPGLRPDQSSSAAAEGDEDSINNYMEALMKRLRQNSAGQNDAAPAPFSQPARVEPVGSGSRRRSTEAPAVRAEAAGSPAAASDGSDVPPQPAARPRPDKTVVRDTVNSLREVANLSARSAVATYVRRKRSRRGLFVGLSYVALLALASALVAGTIGEPLVHTAQPWLVLGMGAVVLVHYFWSVCLADCRHSREWKFVARPRREAAGDADSNQPATNGADAEQRRSPAAMHRAPAGAEPGAYGAEDLEPAEESACAGSSR